MTDDNTRDPLAKLNAIAGVPTEKPKPKDGVKPRSGTSIPVEELTEASDRLYREIGGRGAASGKPKSGKSETTVRVQARVPEEMYYKIRQVLLDSRMRELTLNEYVLGAIRDRLEKDSKRQRD